MPAVQPDMSGIDFNEMLSDEELEALTQPGSPDEVDSWAEALDEEYERKVAGDESIPDWYMEALERAEADRPQTGMLPASVVEEIENASPVVESKTATSDMPDWLRETSNIEEEVAALPGDVPDWLRTMADESTGTAPVISAPATSDSNNWLTEGVTETAVADLPDWLREAAPATPEPEPEPAPVMRTPEPPPAPRPEPQPEPVRQRPPEPTRPEPVRTAPVGSASPEAHGRLSQARQAVSGSQLNEGLSHYQSLVDRAELLEETRGDLRQLIEQNPKEPRLRRLLGDTHMRLGDLQAALDTYRSALDQL
jgi:hypothetical protein